MLNKAQIRDIVISVVLILAAAIVVFTPVEKNAANTKLHLVNIVPETFAGWGSRTYDTSNYADKWQSINELLVREYVRTSGVFVRDVRRLEMVFEYSSDLRKNFSLHFPENCHRAAGNEIEFLKPLVIELAPGKTITGKALFIRGMKNSYEDTDKIVVYWLVIDGKQYYKTFDIKIDQMLSGLLKQSKTGFLTRFDYSDGVVYTPESIANAQEKISGFVKDLYNSLDGEKRKMLFGKGL